MKFVAEVKPRFDYGRAKHKLDITGDGFVFTSNGLHLTLNPTGGRSTADGTHSELGVGADLGCAAAN